LIVVVYDSRRTIPASPSTSIIWPSVIREVAFPVPTTAGDAVLAGDHRAVAENAARVGHDRDGGGESGVHGGAVVSTTSTSRGCSLLASARE